MKAQGYSTAHNIGSDVYDNTSNDGTLTLGSTMKVTRSGASHPVSAANRVSACHDDDEYVMVEECEHSGATYSQISEDEGDYYHHVSCSYCEGEDEVHTSNGTGYCSK